MIKNCLLTIILLSSFTFLNAQNRYVIRFADRTNSPFTITQPHQYLSQRAIDRRNRYNIAIELNDLPVNPNYVQGVAATGATILNISKWFNAVIIETLNPNVLNAISLLPYVINTTNVGRHALQNVIPVKNKFDDEYQAILNNAALRTATFNYNHSFNQISMIGLDGLHNLGFAGDGMIIAVLDAGFKDANLMSCFDSLFLQNRVISTYDFVNHETNVYNDNYHGASVLSCMAANVPGEFIGTAPHASYILLVSEDAATENIIEEYNWSVAAEYADSSGADVINTSLGYTTFDIAANDHTRADMNGNTCPASIAADIAAKKGILVVASAGNEGGSQWQYIGSPADADSILAVGAVDSLGQYAYFSSTGPSVDGRVKPDIADQGYQTWLYVPGNPNPQTGNGTSFSGPVLAGAAACLWQAWPAFNNMRIIDAIKRSASQYANPDSLLGYGIPNFSFANNLLNLAGYTIPDNEVMHLFPNPWNGTDPLNIFFKSDSSQKAELTITEMSGKIVLRKYPQLIGGGYTHLILKENIASGMYLVSIKSTDGTFVKRFVRR